MAELHETGGRSCATSVGMRSASTPTMAIRRRTRAAHSQRGAHHRAQQSRHGALGDPPAPPAVAKLFENLQFIVIDELHGIAACSAATWPDVLRRLQRICRHYGSNPQFICLVRRPSPTVGAGRSGWGPNRPFSPRRQERPRPPRREVLRLRQSAGGESRAGHPQSYLAESRAWRGSSCAATCR